LTILFYSNTQLPAWGKTGGKLLPLWDLWGLKRTKPQPKSQDYENSNKKILDSTARPRLKFWILKQISPSDRVHLSSIKLLNQEIQYQSAWVCRTIKLTVHHRLAGGKESAQTWFLKLVNQVFYRQTCSLHKVLDMSMYIPHIHNMITHLVI
jgi:hypothetical protein